jgi:drug/metabolite transporter (DMT)-like permease
MASYAFLSPLFGVIFGWLIIGEALTLNIILALALVAAGIYLVNRR